MKPTVPIPVKRAAVPRVRKPDKPILRLIDRVTITVDVAKCMWAAAALVSATNAPTVATTITKAAVHFR